MKVKFKQIYIAIFILHLLNSSTDAKGGRGIFTILLITNFIIQ